MKMCAVQKMWQYIDIKRTKDNYDEKNIKTNRNNK
jgi:chromatin remodeling complex protein RSC6